uniref:RNA-directed DNA polymerase, eukaryota n=1 Tax=Tanacetum cinerariifolium TaxID=118510 RepID=A0A6L2KPJ7_TANCI|nr:RNA-directed DNA polymerase, eukaryota [Tanacetum cinerariifolium]
MGGLVFRVTLPLTAPFFSNGFGDSFPKTGLCGFDFKSHCKIRVVNGLNTRFWLDSWITDQPVCTRFLRIFALKSNKVVSIASKRSDLTATFRRQVWDGVENQQWTELLALYNLVSFSHLDDRWYCDLNGEGLFRVKDIRLAIDEMFLPGLNEVTRWVNYVPIKVNILVWRARLDRLSTKTNLINRGISLDSDLCSICGIIPENANHIFFRCELSRDIGASLIFLRRSVPRCLTILSRFRFFGVLIDVLVIFLMKTGLKLLI